MKPNPEHVPDAKSHLPVRYTVVVPDKLSLWIPTGQLCWRVEVSLKIQYEPLLGLVGLVFEVVLVHPDHSVLEIEGVVSV